MKLGKGVKRREGKRKNRIDGSKRRKRKERGK